MPEGNHLGKARKNFFLSRDCCDLIVELCQKFGLSESAVLELAVREKYFKEIGPWKIKGPRFPMKEEGRAQRFTTSAQRHEGNDGAREIPSQP